MPCGVYRCVIYVGNFVIKLPRIKHLISGMRCNRWEKEVWEKWQPIFKWDYLCPVIFSDPIGIFVIMPRAVQPVDGNKIKTLSSHGPEIAVEYKIEDWGYIEGKICAFDYGLPDAYLINTKREELNKKARQYFSI